MCVDDKSVIRRDIQTPRAKEEIRCYSYQYMSVRRNTHPKTNY
jgi:hypothetical protein